jgi:hypothetical protein
MALELTPEEVARRKPLWCAMAELYLDTETQPYTLRSIVRVIREAGYTDEEAYKIFRDDVTPVFGGNAMQVAGEWVPWGDEYVEESVLRFLGRPAFWKSFRRSSPDHFLSKRFWSVLVPYLNSSGDEESEQAAPIL